MNQLPGDLRSMRTNSSGWLLIAALLSVAGFVALRYSHAGFFGGEGSPTHASVEPAVRTSVATSKELPRAEPVGYAAWGSMGTSS
jgi:hypothetical protein